MARKPESELTIRDHDLKPLGANSVRVLSHTFHLGDKVTGVDKYRQTVVGYIRRLYYMDTKISATSRVTYLKTTKYLASVEYSPATPDKPGSSSVVMDLRKLSHAHTELPVGRA